MWAYSNSLKYGCFPILIGFIVGRRTNTVCEVCGKGLYRRIYELKKYSHFCCNGCRSELYKKTKTYFSKGLEKGRGWNKGKSKKMGDKLTYGKPRSEITKQKMSKVRMGIVFSEEHKDKLRVNMVNRRGNQKKKGTDIEIVLENWFIENKIIFEKHKPLLGICNPDFFIKPNNCVFADGDYWHSSKKVIERDKKINFLLEKNGFKVIRLKGSEIKYGVRPFELL